MDVVQKVRDLMKLTLDERTPTNERLASAIGAFKLIEKYELIGNKRIDVAVDIIEKFTNPDFVENVASRVERVTAGIDRIVGSAKKVAGLSGAARSGARSGGRRRRYG